MPKTPEQLLNEANFLLLDLVHSREFILYIGLDGTYHNKIKQWFNDLEEWDKENAIYPLKR